MFIERNSTKPEISLMEGTSPYVVISQEALAEMQVYVKECPDEIGWLGTIKELDDERGFFLEYVFLFDQEVHATTTEITPEGLEDFANEILTLEDGVDLWNSMRLWGHSHVNMDVFPSGQDEKQMEEFQKGGHPYFFRLIANKKGQLKIDMFNYESGVIYKNIPWIEEYNAEIVDIEKEIEELHKLLIEKKNEFVNVVKDEVKAEMATKVRKKSYVSVGKNSFGKGAYGYYVGGKQVQLETQQTNVGFEWNEQYIQEQFTPFELTNFAVMTLDEIEEEMIQLGYVAGEYDFNDLKAIKRFAEKMEVEIYDGFY